MAYELSDRLINVLVHLADDKTTAEISKLVNFSERTVKMDISKLMTVFNVSNRTGLVAKAIRAGVIE